MLSVLSRIWTRVAMSISYDDNHCTTGTPVDNAIFFFFFGKAWTPNLPSSLSECCIARYTDLRNRHKESKNTKLTKLVQARNFILFELKVFRHEERETIFLCWLLLHRQLSKQPMRSARSAQSRLASPSSESQPSSSKARTQLTAFSQISDHASSAWRHSHLQAPFSIWDFILTSVNDTSSPHANTYAHVCT